MLYICDVMSVRYGGTLPYKRIVSALKIRIGRGGGGRNSVWSLLYSILRKRHEVNSDQVHGDYWNKDSVIHICVCYAPVNLAG